jgi:2-dehydro-3-deoxyphosphooctonate aldolase (KDO 8-P synthase)
VSRERFSIGEGERAVTAGGERLFFIAGPCVVESRDSALRHAERIAGIARERGVGVVYKSSYDKANRTSHASFRGIGRDEGLAILAEVRREIGLPVLTDVHETVEVGTVAEVADVLQIPAFLCRQTDLVAAAAASGRALNIKKGQFLAPWDMEHVLAKARAAGGRRVMLTERGTTFGYQNLVNDFRGLAIMRAWGAPIVFDATHSVQLPGAGGGVSSGDRRFIAPLARAAVAVGVDGVFLEVHEDPDRALSDGPNSLPLERLGALFDALLAVDETRRAHPDAAEPQPS